MDGQCHLLVDGFKCVEKTSQFSKDYIENYNKDSDAGCFLEVDVQYILKSCMNIIMLYLFCLKNERLEKI